MTPLPIPDTRVHVIREAPLEAVLPLADLRSPAFARLKAPREKREEVRRSVQRLAATGAFPLAGIYRFARAHREGDEAVLDIGGGEVLPARVPFPRTAGGWSAADALSPDPATGDSVAVFVVTAGRVAPQARLRAEDGHLVEAHLLEVTALALAEGCAEWMHRQIRKMWGIGPEEGFRVSPGYPACPDLGIQQTLFDLLSPGAVGVTLTEAMMMDPEASVSAIVFHSGKREGSGNAQQA